MAMRQVTAVVVRGAPRLLLWLLQGCATAAAIALVSAMTSLAVAAEQPFAAPKAADPVAATSAGSLAQVTLSLILVLAAVFAAAWLVRRLRNLGRPGAGAIQIVADVALGTKERAVLLQVGTQQLLIGVAPGRVNMLHVVGAAGAHPHPPRSGGGDDARVDLSSSSALARGESAQGQGPGSSSVLSQGAAAAGAGWPGAGQRPDFKAILKRSLGL